MEAEMTKGNTMLRAALIALALALSAAPVSAGVWDDALAAHARGDYAEAVRLFRPLAEQGDASAQYNLGFMYNNGEGVPQDYVEAVKWYRMAAEQDHADAQYNLGLMYDNGQGVPQDYAEAVKWYRMAAEQGYATAQSNLGVMYATGSGVPQDDVLAHMWFNLAAAQGHANAKKGRDIVAKLMTSEQIAEAQRLAREWKPK
jgi:TPR repeat protein